MDWEAKAWGEVKHVFESESCAVSFLKVNEGFRCSKHYHEHRDNMFYVVAGCIAVDVWNGSDVVEEVVNLFPRCSFTVLHGIVHRFRVLESGEVVEVYTSGDGQPVRINDIVRFDVGGRA